LGWIWIAQNVRRIVNWGPPFDIESYIQETGQAGRDGKVAYAIFYSKDLWQYHIEDSMKNYCHDQLN